MFTNKYLLILRNTIYDPAQNLYFMPLGRSLLLLIIIILSVAGREIQQGKNDYEEEDRKRKRF